MFFVDPLWLGSCHSSCQTLIFETNCLSNAENVQCKVYIETFGHFSIYSNKVLTAFWNIRKLIQKE